MAITINGSGTITGISAGGLPDDSITAAELGTKTFVSYAVICDQKAYNASGGTFNSGAWRTRDLNTEITDADGIVSISSNQFTLGAGNYLIKWFAPGYNCGGHITILYNATDSATAGTGSSQYSSSGATENKSFGSARIAITGSKAFEIQHQCSNSGGSEGFGNSAGVSGFNSIYTTVEIYKEA